MPVNGRMRRILMNLGILLVLSGVPAFPQKPEPPREQAGGSAYIPIDSWIYATLDRLAALGLIPSQTSGLRPWTRTECKRQLVEAEGRLAHSDARLNTEATRLVGELRRGLDAAPFAIDSVYLREGIIAGPALTDSFHFGQTWTNYSGRPFGQGWNTYDGFAGHAEWNRFFAFVDGEYQHAPAISPYPLSVRQTLAELDEIPLQPAAAGSSTNRFRALDTYIGARFGDFEFSVGKQTLFWGPTADSPLSFGDNAEPTKNFRASTVHPIPLPGPLHHFGEVRAEFVLGKLGGQRYTWRPWFNAQKITFKLAEDIEVGFTRWSILWGAGHPMTIGSFTRNLTSVNSRDDDFGRLDPGDRKGGFDFRLRVPGLRNWLTLYSDSYCDDDPSPLAAPSRAAITPGIYLARVPGVSHLDLRVEAPSTKPMEGDMGGTFIYWNSQYKSGNTNYGYLIGNAAGRDARVIDARATYWFSAKNKFSAEYRDLKGGSTFLPGGMTQNDGSLRGSFYVSGAWSVDIFVQYERFWVPLLGGPMRNLSSLVQLTCTPPSLQFGKTH